MVANAVRVSPQRLRRLARRRLRAESGAVADFVPGDGLGQGRPGCVRGQEGDLREDWFTLRHVELQTLQGCQRELIRHRHPAEWRASIAEILAAIDPVIAIVSGVGPRGGNRRHYGYA